MSFRRTDEGGYRLIVGDAPYSLSTGSSARAELAVNVARSATTQRLTRRMGYFFGGALGVALADPFAAAPAFLSGISTV